MARAETGPVVAVEVLEEEDVVLPRRVGLEAVDPAEAGAAAVGADEEDGDQPPADVEGDVLEPQAAPRADRVLERHVVPEEARVTAEGVDDEVVDGHPD